ncbi:MULTISPECIES: transporter substrate-binding domain-containing protein [Rhizobium]|uniref:Transporter substrate-binding domain-containing protein n=1 Tax=Rhizobium rhododendri TaxID=2506430 RepID=A0ABY8ICS5_9HYPH|nr:MULTISPECIES: transporter substrate-binding domain-containing protein [Rhizobium]MBZ5758682.1 transporter substrate-binding domain-containing protein [Rhizobium sp. VS19-DR96]MBZ5764488.1 transporter substrate-binding domain-containing protein [Rhizobium sp. VS19-DR129.2]MBZ5772031.1 transporter substrate-binding domain-containing protein [Rhizobium sp. VS19-DRK62.2]MBZ5783282.1 transporter substrate-binding domain-containing protein [Rhizobium sp. VS19-DR121]MBZ5800730.1 transporter substr
MIKMLLPLLIASHLTVTAEAQTVSFVTEEYPPFSYREGSDIKGAAVDQIKLLMRGLNDFTIDVVPWARAYSQARTTPMNCVFATAHTTERDALFKWVEPLLIDRNFLVKHTGTAVNAATLEQARQFSVGTWREDYTETLLRNLDFPKIDVATTMSATLKKLMNDRIDMMPLSEPYMDKLIKEGKPLERVVLLSRQVIGIACHKDFPEDLRQKMQVALTALIADGTQKQLFEQYGMALEN